MPDFETGLSVPGMEIRIFDYEYRGPTLLAGMLDTIFIRWRVRDD
jgi:hypothetical protein